MTKSRLLKVVSYTTLLPAALTLGGCAAPGQPSTVKAPDSLGHKPALYIALQRDQRLPAAFTDSFTEISRQALPDFDLAVSEGRFDDAEMVKADWVMSVRATRIIPNYTYKPFADNALNGVNDNLWGSGLGLGLFVAPSVFYGDEDFLEANIRDAQGKTLKTYQVKATEAGIFWLLFPSAFAENTDESCRWRKQINSLYEKIGKDKVFENPQ